MNEAEATATRLENAFREVHTIRMIGMPVLNDALDVRAVGLTPWNGFWFGILITPWFMNVVLLPQEPETQSIRSGEKRLFAFPAGSFEFIRGHEDGLGPFWMCSLFSPVFEFEDMETAVAAAEAALGELLQGGDDDADREMRMIWKGELPEKDDAGAVDQAEPETVPAVEDEGAKPAPSELSRRGLLTGFKETAP